MVILQNEELTVEISELGAEMQSVVTKEGKERIWNGDPAIWRGRAPHLFPICGRLKDNKYFYNGKEYNLGSHGFAKLSEFVPEKVSDTVAVFTLEESEATLINYPFAFRFDVKYTLEGRRIHVEYSVYNKNEDTMYFSVGSHEGYMCEGGIEEYYIEFDKNVTLDTHEIVGPIVSRNTERILENSNILPLKNDYFAVDALVFKDIDFDTLSIKRKNGDLHVRVDFKGAENLLMWTIPGAPYICIEPLFGFPDFVDTDQIFENKYGIQQLESGNRFTATHTITF